MQGMLGCLGTCAELVWLQAALGASAHPPAFLPTFRTQTHTMSGTDIGEYANRGINYRALDDLFELNRQRELEVGSRAGFGNCLRA